MMFRFIADQEVSAIGMGAMGLSVDGRPDEREAIKTIHAAIDAGITFIDTADCYCTNSETEHNHNEYLIKKALDSYSSGPKDIAIATKGGLRKPASGSWPINGDPSYLKSACEKSLKALGVDSIFLYQLHAPDPKIDFATSVGALSELMAEGKIRNIGLSNVNLDQINTAMTIAPIASIQNEFSVFNQTDAQIVDMTSAWSIAYIAYSPLGGLNSSSSLVKSNKRLIEIAQKHGVSPQQVALSWLLARSDSIIPIPSFRRPETALDSAKAADLTLDPEDLEALFL
jgi:aryl-alcohol dehydrogenase-like predicted oxidoreductase